MSAQLIPLNPAAQTLALMREYEDVRLYSRAASTRAAYAVHWRHFEAFCRQHGAYALPTNWQTIAAYLLTEADKVSPSTLSARMAAIAAQHANCETNPTAALPLKELLKGIRRKYGRASKPKEPTLTEDIQAMCDAQPATLAGLRNRAVLLVGFASAMRRGELAALDVEDLRFSREGLQLKIRKSKTDQESRGQTVALPYLSGSPYCPVLALRAWLDASGIKSGALFRRISKAGRIANRTIRTRKGLELSPRHSGESIAAILKAAVKAIGKDPAIFGGHSLRSGHATQAAKNGAEIPVMMKQTRHTSVDSLAGYIRDANLFEQNSASLLGL